MKIWGLSQIRVKESLKLSTSLFSYFFYTDISLHRIYDKFHSGKMLATYLLTLQTEGKGSNDSQKMINVWVSQFITHYHTVPFLFNSKAMTYHENNLEWQRGSEHKATRLFYSLKSLGERDPSGTLWHE